MGISASHAPRKANSQNLNTPPLRNAWDAWKVWAGKDNYLHHIGIFHSLIAPDEVNTRVGGSVFHNFLLCVSFSWRACKSIILTPRPGAATKGAAESVPGTHAAWAEKSPQFPHSPLLASARGHVGSGTEKTLVQWGCPGRPFPSHMTAQKPPQLGLAATLPARVFSRFSNSLGLSRSAVTGAEIRADLPATTLQCWPALLSRLLR